MMSTVIDLNVAARQNEACLPCADAQKVLSVMARRMEVDGLGLQDIVPDGTMHRFALPDDRGGKRSGWYVAYADGVACGVWGNWKTGLSEKITGLDDDLATNAPARIVSELERTMLRQRIESMQAAREAERQTKAREARKWSAQIYAAAHEAGPENPYLRRKGLTAAPGGAREDSSGALIIPLYDSTGSMAGVQRISPDGSKRFPWGFAKKGCFAWLDGAQETVLICEGYATACSLHAATGYAVVAALDAGNLPEVAPVIRQVLPQCRIIICADNDQWTQKQGRPWNPGMEYARRAANAVGGSVISPSFRDLAGNPTDFNDLQVREGLDEVRQQVTPHSGVPRLADWFSGEAYLGEAPEQQWLVDGVLPLGAPCLLVASGGTGKGMLALDLGLRVAGNPMQGIDLNYGPGDTWLGGEVTAHGSVVILSSEDTRDDIHRRLESMDEDGSRRAAARGRLAIVPLPNTGGPVTLIRSRGFAQGYETTPEYDDLVRQLTRIPDLKLINIDPLAAFVACDINADPQAGAFTQGVLAQLAERTGATVLVAHHMAKALATMKDASPESARLSIRGTTALVDGVRLAIAIWPADTQTRKDIEQKIGRPCKPNEAFCGAVVKANCQADGRVRPLLRGENGVLQSVRLKDEVIIPREDQLRMLADAVAAKAVAGAPFTSSIRSSGGIVGRRDELRAPLCNFGTKRLSGLLEEALSRGFVVRCTYKKSVGRYLDVPTGPFATGSGEVEEGATNDVDA